MLAVHLTKRLEQLAEDGDMTFAYCFAIIAHERKTLPVLFFVQYFGTLSQNGLHCSSMRNSVLARKKA